MQPVQESYVWNLRKRRIRVSPFLQSDFYKTTATSHTICGVQRDFVQRGGVQQIQFRTVERENGDLGAVAP